MRKLGDEFREINKNNPLSLRLADIKVLATWEKVVGEAIRENTRPQKMHNGILYIFTKSPSWSQELKALELNIKKQINEQLGADMVRGIRFINKGKLSQDPDDSAEDGNIPDIDKIELSPDDAGYIEDIAALVKEDDLRERLINLAQKDKKLKTWRNLHS